MSRYILHAWTYVSEVLDNLKLIIDLVVEDSVLHKLAFVKLFYGKDLSVSFGGKFVYHRKSSFANIPNNVVLISATPVHAIVGLHCRGGKESR